MDLEQRILYEDNHLIAFNKVAGEIVQGDKTEDVPMSENVKQYLKVKYEKKGNVYLAVIHRIDRPVSGVIIFAKTSKAAAKMSSLIQTNSFHKTYLAATYNKPEHLKGKLVSYIYKNEKQNKSYIVQPSSLFGDKINDPDFILPDSAINKQGIKLQRAELNYKYLSKNDNYHLLEIELITGRHHQIRSQLASIGCIIKGDLKYGAPRSNPDASISLHAYNVSFIHPIKNEPVSITAPLHRNPFWSSFK